MNITDLKERFSQQLTPPLPSAWEVEENLQHLTELSARQQDLILAQVQAIWPVSNSLCFSYLACADKALACLTEEQITPWVAALLATYEKKGLKAAQTFMADVESNFLCELRGERGIRLDDVAARLGLYATGIINKPVTFARSGLVYTDTSQIFLPGKIFSFSSEAQNFLLYKLMITSQLALIKAGTYEFVITADAPLARQLRARYQSAPTGPEPIRLENFWAIFPDPRLAEDIFTLVEGQRLSRYLARFFPGLWRDTAKIRLALIKHRPVLDSLSRQSRLLETLARQMMGGAAGSGTGLNDPDSRLLSDRFPEPTASVADSAARTATIYQMVPASSHPYEPIAPVPYLGRLQPAAAHLVILKELATLEEKFIQALAAIMPAGPARAAEESTPEDDPPGAAARINGDQATALLFAPNPGDKKELPLPSRPDTTQVITIDNQEVALPESLKKLAAQLNCDLGQIPAQYISAASGLAGRGNPPANIVSQPVGDGLTGLITYDEWDFRRAGFRKNWCILNEKRIEPVKGTFVHATLEKYRGVRHKLKRQFEMLRCSASLSKRQKDGDDIDLDAVIEAFSDLRAGKAGSEHLYVKLHRNDRDIAVMFLLDMSSSTEGWVGKALKEALILMGESLEILGDRYAIAGFSGMRRTRSDFYLIKDFSEKYDAEIKGRIAAIAPKEYTRMGPAVRHASRIMQDIEAKTRLLIILTDGKPEDYDDYKGEYAIEDTRHALIEAKNSNIQPFCINIDQQAHDYNRRLYGAGNYIFLNKVSELPIRMPAIYRNLTT